MLVMLGEVPVKCQLSVSEVSTSGVSIKYHEVHCISEVLQFTINLSSDD